MRRGTGVRLPDGSIGIILGENKGCYRVLCEDFNVYPIRPMMLEDTGKYFDLSIVFDTIRE